MFCFKERGGNPPPLRSYMQIRLQTQKSNVLLRTRFLLMIHVQFGYGMSYDFHLDGLGKFVETACW